MKYKKALIPILLVSAVVLSACGKKKENRQLNNTVPKAVLSPEKEIEQEKEDIKPVVIFYTVRLTNKTLSLYEVDGENQKLITSMEIEPELYPEEDVEKLKDGISVAFKEEGYELLENFAN